MRVFLDTNVLVAAVAARGLCADLFEILLQSQELLTSEQVLDEVDRVLRTKLGMPTAIVDAFVGLIEDEAEKVVPGGALPSVADPDDGPIIAAAINGGADAFVTGDNALLQIGNCDGLQIVSPRAFYGLLSGET